MLMNNHIIEEFSWVTAPLHNHDKSHVIKATVTDYQNRGEMDQDIFGIMPNYFATTISDFSSEYHDYEGWD